MQDKINQLLALTQDNNRMLKEIIEYINMVNRNHNTENNEDFARNILANLISNKFDISNYKRY